MDFRESARAPFRFVILFVLTAGIPLGVLGWAALWTFDRDRVQEADKLQTRVGVAAEAVAAELERGLSLWEERLATVAGYEQSIPPGAAVLQFDARGVVARHGAKLPYYPEIAHPIEVPHDVFEDAEASELR